MDHKKISQKQNYLFSKKEGQSQEHLYLQVYHYYKDLIMSRRLQPGNKMPSLRKCAQELRLSRTTIESAYLQLAADGYIISKAQSGYYVTDIVEKTHEEKRALAPEETLCLYDLSSSGVDKESFRFDLWQRYLKSALRQNDRLLSYGEPQGEADLRQALCDYVREKRNIVCSPEDIVVAAGVQSLLQLLCPMIRDKKTVSFPTPSFVQGSTVFEDYGFQICYRNKDSGVIYVSPAHMTKWGEIMPVSRRLELIRHASENNSLIIEDDLENEFVYLQKPTPSLFSLAGGQEVVYIGSFSRLLLPSIRISFMILPPGLTDKYRIRAALYNQTASKAEQIALCQFIRDGHLTAQTRRLKRLYSSKLKELLSVVKETFGKESKIQIGAAGTSLALTLPFSDSGEALKKKALARGLRLKILQEDRNFVTLLLSCSALPLCDFRPALALLKETIASP